MLSYLQHGGAILLVSVIQFMMGMMILGPGFIVGRLWAGFVAYTEEQQKWVEDPANLKGLIFKSLAGVLMYALAFRVGFALVDYEFALCFMLYAFATIGQLVRSWSATVWKIPSSSRPGEYPLGVFLVEFFYFPFVNAVPLLVYQYL